jgi:probable HAF family extracellular repeat protein
MKHIIPQVLVTVLALSLAGCVPDTPVEPGGDTPAGPSERPVDVQFAANTVGNITVLGTLGGDHSYAYDINAGGQIVGVSTTSAGASHAFSWQNGTISDLGTLGGSSSQAQGVSDAGQVAGFSSISDGAPHAFLWQNSIMTDLGTLPGARV